MQKRPSEPIDAMRKRNSLHTEGVGPGRAEGGGGQLRCVGDPRILGGWEGVGKLAGYDSPIS